MAGWTANGRLPHRGEPRHTVLGTWGQVVTCSPHSVYGISSSSPWIRKGPMPEWWSHLSFQLAISGKLPLPLVQGQPGLPSEFQVSLGHRVKLYLKKHKTKVS